MRDASIVNGPIVVNVFIATTAVSLLGFGIYELLFASHRSKLPPHASGSWWHNLKSRTTKDARDRFDDGLRQSLEIYNQDTKRFKNGAVFQFSVPFQRATTIYVADYKLARLLLMGDSSKV